VSPRGSSTIQGDDPASDRVVHVMPKWAVTGPGTYAGLVTPSPPLSKQDADLFSILIGRIGYDADVDRIERVGY
jgi:hypothetical protein